LGLAFNGVLKFRELPSFNPGLMAPGRRKLPIIPARLNLGIAWKPWLLMIIFSSRRGLDKA